MKTTHLCLSAALLSLGGACSHTSTVAAPPEAAAQSAEASAEGGAGASEAGGPDSDSTSDSDEGDEVARERGSKPERRSSESGGEQGDETEPDPEDIEVATSAKGLLEPGAEDQVRERLGVPKGEGYRGALMRFQREHDLPATGILDHETAEALGLNPSEIFASAGD